METEIILTDHPQQMLRTIDLTHLLLLANDNILPCYILPSSLSILWSLKPVQQIRAQTSIKIQLQTRQNRWQKSLGCGKMRFRGSREGKYVCLELGKNIANVWGSWEGDELLSFLV